MDDKSRNRFSALHNVPNSEILGEFASTFPPTLRDIQLHTGDEEQKFRILDALVRIWTSPGRWEIWSKPLLAWDSSQQIRHRGAWLPFLDSLPTNMSAQHSVFLVSRPSFMWPTATGHWSLYCQGRYYHLAAPGMAKDPLAAKSSPGLDLMRVPLVLKVQDFSNPETGPPQQGHRALVAYQVGKTDYPAEAIEKLAKWIIKNLDTYDFFNGNCQHFVMSLMSRTIMTKQDYSVFIGTAAQMAHWDLVGRHIDQRFFDIDHGFLIQKPRSITPYSFLAYTIFLPHYLRAIRNLYDNGERSSFSFDPSGHRNLLRYWGHRLIKDFSKAYTEVNRSNKEMIEDARRGRWHDAFIGRLQTRLEMYAGIKDKVEKGSKSDRWMLPFHRWVLFIPAEYR